MNALLGNGGIFGVEFYEDGVALETVSNKASGAGTAEGIEDGARN